MKTEHNHYIKRTILLNWLIKDKFYYFDKADSTIKELGKNKSDTQFTSLLINKNTENIIDTNKIENSFEDSIKNYVRYGDFINPDFNIPEDKLNKIKQENYEKIFETSVDYISLQIARNPNNTYKYFPEFKKGIEEQSIFFKFISQQQQKECIIKEYKKIFDEQPNYYQLLFNKVKNEINTPIEFYLISATANIFHLSEGNTTSLDELLNIYNNGIVNTQLNEEQLKKSYLTVLSPKLILFLNCNSKVFTHEEINPIINNIGVLWANFSVKSGFEKIILANNTKNEHEIINKILSAPISQDNLSVLFKTSEFIYKKYYL